MRFVRRPHRMDEVACIDTTGGTVKAVHLTDNGIAKVLLTLTKNGVSVEMALTSDEAEDFHADLCEAIAWAVAPRLGDAA